MSLGSRLCRLLGCHEMRRTESEFKDAMQEITSTAKAIQRNTDHIKSRLDGLHSIYGRPKDD